MAAAIAATLALSLFLSWASLARSNEIVVSLPSWQQAKLETHLLASALWMALVACLLAFSSLSNREAISLRARSRRVERTNSWAKVALAFLIVCYVAAYGWLSIERHRRFNSTGYDLAIKEQVVWNTVHGRFFASSVEVDNAFEDHFQPLMLAFALPYVVIPHTELLLLMQTVGLGLGAIPLFHLARRRLDSWPVALALSACYLLYPALGFVNRFDFHPEAMAIPAFMAAFDALDRGHLRWTSTWLLLAMLGKENLGFSVAAFALYAVLAKKQRLFGLAWLAVGVTFSIVTSFYVIPALRGEPTDTAMRYAWLGEDPLEMLYAVISRPGQVWRHVVDAGTALYALQLLLPTAFLALAGLPELLISVPGLALNLLADHFCQPQIYCQYTVPIVPFVAVAGVLGLNRLRSVLDGQWTWRLAGFAVVPLALLAFFLDNPFTEDQQLPAALARLPNEEAVYGALPYVPPEASLVTTNAYAPHLPRREGLYIIGVPAQREPPPGPQAIFINLYDQRYITCDQYRDFFAELEADQYGMVFRDSGVVVVVRGEGSREGFRDFVENWTDCAG
jgi:uncharacterized membrane protein